MTNVKINMNADLASIPRPALKPQAFPAAASFPAHLSRVISGGDRESLRESVEQLVASSLVMPTLSTLRESTMGVGAFAPGTAEKRFGPLLDQHLSDEITKGANFPLVDAIVNKLARRYGLSSPPPPPVSKTGGLIREAIHA